MDERGHPPSHAQTREMATEICLANGDTAPLGQQWVTQFRRRYLAVHSVIIRVIEAARI